MKLRALSVLTAILVFACQAYVEEPLKEVRYEGSIDHEFQAFLRELDGLKVRITLTSSGGRVEDALDAAELAAKNSWKLRIQSICYSSCAEIFVLADPAP